MAVDPNNQFLYVANRDENTIMIIDLFENKIVDTIEVGTAPFGLALNLERNELYSANVRSNNVSVIELDTKKNN